MWQISVDWLVIARLLAAIGWGFAFAIFLYRVQRGKELRRDHTWVTVVIGVGFDLLLSFPADWFTGAGVIACSSIGIIGFAIFYHEEDIHGYNAIEYIEQAIGGCLTLMTDLENALDTCGEHPEVSKSISHSLRICHRIYKAALMARNGKLIEKSKKAK